MAQQYSGDSPRKYGKGTDVPYERNVSVNSEVYDDKDYGRVGASGDDQRFARAECKDVFWAALFLAHFFAVVIIGFYYYSMYHTEIGAAQDLNAATSSRPRLSVNGNFWVIVGVSLLGGLALSVLWLVVIRTWPKAVIWFSIVFVFVVLTVLTVYLFLRARYWQAALMLIVIAVMVVWVVLIQRRIKFSMVMLEVVVNFIQTFPSVIYFAVALVLVQGAWLVIWALCTIAILYAADGKVAASKKELTGFTFFAMAISFFWTTQVVKNLVHMTTVGTLATWAFYPEEQRPDQPAMRSFKRAITTSFGSICLGSLIVAIIRAIRLMIENTVENDFLRCCAVCIMDCIDGIVRYFNMYAYTKCAIYGLSYCEAAVETWKLLLSRGIVMAINDDIIGMVLFTGSIIGGLATAGMAAFIANAFESESKIIILYAVLGFLVGLAMTICAMEVVESGVAALFVCYADDPAAIEQAQPAVFAKVHRAFRETYPHGDDL